MGSGPEEDRTAQQLTGAGRVSRSGQQAELNTCAICLAQITERAVASPCNHLEFDFLCLVQWLQTSSTCPLCKTEVNEVHYDFRDTSDYKRYVVPNAIRQPTSSHPPLPDPTRAAPSQSLGDCHPPENESLNLRRRIYEQGLFSSHIGSNAYSGFQYHSPETFSRSAALQAKARLFLRRELQVFQDKFRPSTVTSNSTSNSTSAGRVRSRRGAAVTVDYMIEFIVAVLRAHAPKSFEGRAEELIGEFIDLDNARLLLHELDAWLRSPHTRLEDWDQTVQYPAIPR